MYVIDFLRGIARVDDWYTGIHEATLALPIPIRRIILQDLLEFGPLIKTSVSSKGDCPAFFQQNWLLSLSHYSSHARLERLYGGIVSE